MRDNRTGNLAELTEFKVDMDFLKLTVKTVFKLMHVIRAATSRVKSAKAM